MAFFTNTLSFICVAVASANTAQVGQNSHGEANVGALDEIRAKEPSRANAWTRLLEQIREVHSGDHVSMLQTSVQEKINRAERKISASAEDAPAVSAAEACETFEKGYGSDDASADLDEVQVAPTTVVSEAASPPKQSAVEEEPYGAATLKATLELMIVILFVDGVRRWRSQPQEKEVCEKVQSCDNAADAAADRAWEELVLAASVGDENGAQEALAAKAPVRRTDTWGCAPLHFAAVGGSEEVASALLKLGAEVDALDACDESALHFAARAGHPGICEILLSNGADVNRVNNQEMTPMVVAGQAKQEATCRLLADHGGHAGGMADEELPALVICQVVRKVLEAA